MKPTSAELHLALTEAERRRAAGDDDQHMAKTLLYLQQRLRHLEAVRVHAERLVEFGLDEQEHAQLVRALEAARRAEAAAAGGEKGALGLG